MFGPRAVGGGAPPPFAAERPPTATGVAGLLGDRICVGRLSKRNSSPAPCPRPRPRRATPPVGALSGAGERMDPRRARWSASPGGKRPEAGGRAAFGALQRASNAHLPEQAPGRGEKIAPAWGARVGQEPRTRQVTLLAQAPLRPTAGHPLTTDRLAAHDWPPAPGRPLLSACYSPPGYWRPTTCRPLRAANLLLNAYHWPNVVGRLLLAPTSGRLLVAAYWPPVTGRILLAACRWPPTTGVLLACYRWPPTYHCPPTTALQAWLAPMSRASSVLLER